MSHNLDSTGFELQHIDEGNARPTAAARLLPENASMTSNPPGIEDTHTSKHSILSAKMFSFLPKTTTSSQPSLIKEDEFIIEPRKVAVDGRRWVALLRCIPHLVPLSATIAILCLNIYNLYFQDLGRPNQSTILQAFQYAAKAHELLMVASLASIVLHRIQYNLSISKGVPFGFLSASYQLSDPLFIFGKGFYGGATAHTPSKGLARFLPLGFLLSICFILTAIVGPSSAIVMIPRLDWWDVPNQTAFGDVPERIYVNRTAAELWPADITTDLYSKEPDCSNDRSNNNCALSALDAVNKWVGAHQNQGLKPNITLTQDGGVSRFLSSSSGPANGTSWTVASTIGMQQARDLGSFWEWVVENNSSLATDVSRPLITPSFIDSHLQVRKPLVQTQCHTYFDPDFNTTAFEFPHDQLNTPPLDGFLTNSWNLPNDFVINMVGDNKDIGSIPNPGPRILFSWYDTATSFSRLGTPSLGAVVIFRTVKQDQIAVATCSFDGRWAPVSLSLDPRTDTTIRQDSPNPMDILQNPNKEVLKDMTRMKIHMDWADSLNVIGTSTSDPNTTSVEQLLESLGNVNNWNHYAIYPEPDQNPATLAWRISTVLGLYTTEALARAQYDSLQSSVVYHDAPGVNQSFVRPLNNLNIGDFSARIGQQVQWASPGDPAYNSSMPPWDVWAPRNGYTEMKVAVQRYGYGYGFGGLPIILATVALSIYALLAFGHMVLIVLGGRTFNSWAGMGEVIALAWNSRPTRGLRNTSAGIDKTATWSQVVRVGEGEGNQLQLVLGNDERAEGVSNWKPRVGVAYA